MNSLHKYLTLIKEHPEMFRNSGEVGEIKIITDERTIITEQEKLRKHLRENGQPIEWIEIGVLSEDQWFYIVRDLVEFPNGHIGGYLRHINKSSVEGGYGVVMLCVRQDEILMIKKYRHEQRCWNWEFPRGFSEPGLSAEENARKEMREEIGVSPVELRLLTHVKDGKGGVSLFYAELPPDQEIKVDIGESIVQYNWVTKAEIEHMIKLEQLSDYFSLWAYCLAKIDKVI
ncbi:MAG: NUDIX hydrolase [Chloroflexi bacterium]|nr:NUDIX hydrolase [Chloroflexota bacterium]